MCDFNELNRQQQMFFFLSQSSESSAFQRFQDFKVNNIIEDQKYETSLETKLHSDDKLFHCEFCNQQFTQNNTLQTHRRIHTNEKPFKCDICGKSFNTRAQVKQHQPAHMLNGVYVETAEDYLPNSKAKVFNCKLCLKPFNKLLTLKKHEVNCGKVTQDPMAHAFLPVPSSSDSLMFQCKTCKLFYNELKELKEHLKVHDDVKPFRCHICNKAFAKRKGVKKHQTTHMLDGVYVETADDFRQNFEVN